MKKIAVIYHSSHGHTAHIASHIAQGAATVAGTEVHVLQAAEMATAPEALLQYDGLLLGSPTYLGGVSGAFKSFMDATGKMWRTQQLKGKLAAGFTVSSLPAGDKQSTLMSMFTFCMQHGMLWVGNPIIPEQQSGVSYEQAANRLGSWSGMMAQAGHGAPSDEFAPGDIKTALLFGQGFAETLLRLR
ncbi:flavodoxin family protein [Pseudoduganella sp. OTU4001]|uniref:flavodoxin family protein n=1 Tax=Pseudoduganella sp. OTU4001 TaxID=3043854 RepID=UPI00313D7396